MTNIIELYYVAESELTYAVYTTLHDVLDVAGVDLETAGEIVEYILDVVL